jgi:hypothetical protein
VIERVPWSPAFANAFAAAHAKAVEAVRDRGMMERLRADLLKLRDRPLPFVREWLGGQTWSAPRGILRAVHKHKRVAVCGCRKSTKSHTACYAGLSFFCTGPCRVIVTGSTYSQVRENIFARMRKMHAASRKILPGRAGVTSFRMEHDANWFMIGISTNKPGYIQGFHGDIHLDPALEFDDQWVDEDSLLAPDPRALDLDLALAEQAEKDPEGTLDRQLWEAKKVRARLFLILDESAEMRAPIIETLEGSLMGDDAYALQQFNPTFMPESDHPAARALLPGSQWHRIHIAGREPPEGTHGPAAGEPEAKFDECYHGIPTSIMDDAWVAGRIADPSWGPTGAMTMCHVYGLPAGVDAERQFIPPRLIRIEPELAVSGELDDRHIGIDVGASDGGDPSVATLWVGGMLAAQVAWQTHNTMATVGKILELRRKWGVGGEPVLARNVHVDRTGVGHGVVDRLIEMGHWVDGIDFGKGPRYAHVALTGGLRFANLKSELFWVFRRLLEEQQVCVPSTYHKTREQSGWYTYKFSVKMGETVIAVKEDKPTIKTTFGKSPDHFESAAIGLARGGASYSSITLVDSL